MSTILSRWTAKLAIRRALRKHALDQVRLHPHDADALHLLKKREAQVVYAAKVVDRHKLDGIPLRGRAWEQMSQLIAAHVTEQGGNNRGTMVEKIILANGGAVGEPWCGDTVAWCYRLAGAKSVTRSWASVAQLGQVGTRTQLPLQGDIVRYTFDHTGLFDKWAPEVGRGYFYAGEGNTTDQGAVSDSQTGGDGVKLKLRHVNQVTDFRTGVV